MNARSLTSFWAPCVAGAAYVGVEVIWLVPDRRIENALRENA